MKKKILLKILPLFFILIINSCFGLSMDIQARRDGSGRLTMEYRYSSTAESIGRLDGNEMWSIFAVSRADWERTVNRLDGVRLVSFSSRERSDEITARVTLEYDNTNALLSVLDPSGAKASFSQNTLSIILIEPFSGEINSDLLELARQASSGYKFIMSFNSGSSAPLVFTDGRKKEIPQPSNCEITQSAGKVSFSIDMSELLSFTEGFGISVNF